MDDLISRQAAIEEAKTLFEPSNYGYMIGVGYNHAVADCIAILNNLPSAQRKGKWIYLNGLDAFECSVCGRQMVRNIFDYCPWCGAEMTKGEEDE